MREVADPACDHKYVHLDTARFADNSGTYNTKFVRIDRFFCEKCLHETEKVKTDYSRETPDWYR